MKKLIGKFSFIIFLFLISCENAYQVYVFDMNTYIAEEEQDFINRHNFTQEQVLKYHEWAQKDYFKAQNEVLVELKLKEYYLTLLNTNRLVIDTQKQIIGFSRSYFIKNEFESYYYQKESIDNINYYHLYQDKVKSMYSRSIEIYNLNRNKIKLINHGKAYYYMEVITK